MIRPRLHSAALAGIACLIAGSASAAGATTALSTHPAPPADATFDMQIGGSYPPAPDVGIVDRDRTSHPAVGVYNLCYVNAFQTQDYQAAWWKKNHADLLLHSASGALVSDANWPGEILLDTSSAAKRAALAKIVGGWIDSCATKGFDAVDPDNLDSNTRSHHLLTVADNLAFAKLIATRAHADGLAIGQKNDAEISARARRTAHFDFATVESCQVYAECSYYLKTYGAEVLEIEYSVKAYNAACAARGSKISIIRRDLNVVARGKPGYVYDAC